MAEEEPNQHEIWALRQRHTRLVGMIAGDLDNLAARFRRHQRETRIITVAGALGTIFSALLFAFEAHTAAALIGGWAAIAVIALMFKSSTMSEIERRISSIEERLVQQGYRVQWAKEDRRSDALTVSIQWPAP